LAAASLLIASALSAAFALFAGIPITSRLAEGMAFILAAQNQSQWNLGPNLLGNERPKPAKVRS
jgi:hypothetical protein